MLPSGTVPACLLQALAACRVLIVALDDDLGVMAMTTRNPGISGSLEEARRHVRARD
jgi:hypothetical protein